MKDRIDSRLDKIDTYYGAASSETREEADEIIPWKEVYKFESGDRLLRHIREYIADEREKRDDGERSDPLCECADSRYGCPIKRGELPPQIRPTRGSIDALEQDVEERVEIYTNSHPENVVTEALDAWADEYVEILPALTQAVSLLEDEVESDRGLLEV